MSLETDCVYWSEINQLQYTHTIHTQTVAVTWQQCDCVFLKSFQTRGFSTDLGQCWASQTLTNNNTNLPCAAQNLLATANKIFFKNKTWLEFAVNGHTSSIQFFFYCKWDQIPKHCDYCSCFHAFCVSLDKMVGKDLWWLLFFWLSQNAPVS